MIHKVIRNAIYILIGGYSSTLSAPFSADCRSTEHAEKKEQEEPQKTTWRLHEEVEEVWTGQLGYHLPTARNSKERVNVEFGLVLLKELLSSPEERHESVAADARDIIARHDVGSRKGSR